MSLLRYFRDRMDEVFGRLRVFSRRSGSSYRNETNVYDRDSARLSEISANDRNGEGW